MLNLNYLLTTVGATFVTVLYVAVFHILEDNLSDESVLYKVQKETRQVLS